MVLWPYWQQQGGLSQQYNGGNSALSLTTARTRLVKVNHQARGIEIVFVIKEKVSRTESSREASDLVKRN